MLDQVTSWMVGNWEVDFRFARHPATTHEHVYGFDK